MDRAPSAVVTHHQQVAGWFMYSQLLSEKENKLKPSSLFDGPQGHRWCSAFWHTSSLQQTGASSACVPGKISRASQLASEARPSSQCNVASLKLWNHTIHPHNFFFLYVMQRAIWIPPTRVERIARKTEVMSWLEGKKRRSNHLVFSLAVIQCDGIPGNGGLLNKPGKASRGDQNDHLSEVLSQYIFRTEQRLHWAAVILQNWCYEQSLAHYN